jgi:nitroimidazol reductase NimA-like FMN-containing flavoprotein (pyridoxamine 5'-phosphate oxidase superfamily)
MTSNVTGPVQPLTAQECWELIASRPIGRLATAVDRHPDIFPVNFVVDGESIVFRTAEGSKLFSLTINQTVAFEVDDWGEDTGWSVVLHGTAETISAYDEVMEAEQLPLRPWVPTVKTHYVRIRPDRVSGRQFAFGPEPETSFV